MRGTRHRWRWVAALVVVTVAPAFAPPAQAVHRGKQALRTTVRYCVSGAPADVGLSQARSLTSKAVVAWSGPASLEKSQGLTPTQDNPCKATTDVSIRAAALTSLYGTTAVAVADSTSITFNTDVSWWDGKGTRETWEYSWLGVLVHEMGHTFGMGHAGKSKWSSDNEAPTMSDAGSQADTVALQTIQQDDWGMAAYVATGSFWSPNPGFEDGVSRWNATPGVQVGNAYKHSGYKGIRINTPEDSVDLTMVYDPYTTAEPDCVADDHMTDHPTYVVKYAARNPKAGVVRGVEPKYQYRYLQYPCVGTKSDADARATFTSWSAVTRAGGVGKSDTAWWKGTWSIAIPNSAANDATVFTLLVYTMSDDGGPVYLDEVGLTGGMTEGGGAA